MTAEIADDEDRNLVTNATLRGKSDHQFSHITMSRVATQAIDEPTFWNVIATTNRGAWPS